MKATYIRVSTAKQNTITQEMKTNGREYIDKISGVVSFSERPAGGMLLGDIATGKIKHVYVNRIDRLGRNAADIMNTIEILKGYSCQLTVTSMGINLFERGKVNSAFMMVVSLYSQLAEQQREEIREKTAEGIQQAKKRGAFKGRKAGTGETREKFLSKYPEVCSLLRDGVSISKVSNVLKISRPVVTKVKKALNGEF